MAGLCVREVRSRAEVPGHDARGRLKKEPVTNIARDCGVDAKTVREYHQILCDTLLGS